MTAHKPCICLKLPQRKQGRTGDRNHSSFHPHLGAMRREGFLDDPQAHWALSLIPRQISGSSFGKAPGNHREGQWQKSQPGARWGSSPQPVWAPLQVSLCARRPRLLTHGLRIPDVLVEQRRVVSGAVAPDPVT